MYSCGVVVGGRREQKCLQKIYCSGSDHSCNKRTFLIANWKISQS